jgi:hypothetical protein
MTTLIFGYGSLAALPAGGLTRAPSPDGFVADLHGYARGWGVAMDNRVDLPGYKRYRTPAGDRPAVHVCFLDIAPADGASVNGVCLPVDDVQLAGLDDRERNYVRRDVTDRIGGAPGARVWTYVGAAAGRERLARGRRDGDAVIAASYLDGVTAAFAALGADEARVCAPSLDPGGIPVVDLVREDVS